MSTNFGNCPTCCANRREDRRIVDEGDDGDTYCADSWHATHTPPAPAPAEDRDIWQHDETGRIVELPAGSPSPGKRYFRVRGMGGRVSVVGEGDEARVVFTPDARPTPPAPAPANETCPTWTFASAYKYLQALPRQAWKKGYRVRVLNVLSRIAQAPDTPPKWDDVWFTCFKNCGDGSLAEAKRLLSLHDAAPTPAPRCPYFSRAWGVQCDRPAGHDGNCQSGGDGFAPGYTPTPPAPDAAHPALIAAARERDALRDALRRIVAVLSPTPPPACCEGGKAEIEEAVEVARAALKENDRG